MSDATDALRYLTSSVTFPRTQSSPFIEAMKKKILEHERALFERMILGEWPPVPVITQPKKEKKPMKVKEFIALLKTYNQDAELKFYYLSPKSIKQISEISKIQQPEELPEGSRKKPEGPSLVIESITVEIQ